MTKSVDEKTPLLADEEKGMASEDPALAAPVQKIQPGTLLGKFCSKYDICPAFGEHVEIAMRTVFMVVIFIGMQIDPWKQTRPWGHSEWLLLIHPLSLCMLFFGLGKTTGETLYNVWSGMIGTLSATLAIWVLYGLFPGGYYGEKCPENVFWFGIAFGCVFVVTTLWSNSDTGTKIFGLCNWVWFWMDFLNGNENTVNQGFNLNIKGTFMLALGRCAFGSGLAIVIAVLPYPVMAKSKAKQIAKTVASDMCTVWADASASYWDNAECQVYEFDRLLREIHSLHTALDSMTSMNAASWWECLGMGAVGRSRVYLDLLAATLVKNLDRLPSVLKSFAKNAGESSPEEVANHARVAAQLLPSINNVVATTSKLLKLCVEVSCDGEVDEAERAMLATDIEAVKKAVDALRNNVLSKRLNTGTSEKKFDLEYLDEYTFLFCVSHFGRNTANFAQKILDMQTESSSAGLTDAVTNGMTKMKVVLALNTDADTMLFVVRNSIGILTAFALGYRGFSMQIPGVSDHLKASGHTLLPPLSAGAASTLTLMLSKFTGSAMQSTLNRMMGIILGIVSGMMMVGVFGAHLVPLMLVLAIWVGFTIFMYMHSTGNAGTFLLMCIFGVGGMLQRCPAVGCEWDSRKVHAMDPIIDCMFALLVMVVIDLIMRPKPASEQAGAMLVQSWSELSQKVTHIYNNDEKHTHAKQAHIAAHIATCQALGHEACNEPVYWKSAWKGSLYGRVVDAVQDLRFGILCMNCGADVKGEHGNPKSTYFMKFCDVPEFMAVYKKLQERMESMATYMPLFTYESQSRFPPLSDAESLRNFVAEEEELIQAFVKVVNKKESGWMLTESQEDDHIKGSLEMDPIAKLSVIMLCIQALMEDMRNMQHDIMRSS